MKVFAAFIVAKTTSGNYCAVTRNPGFGLPGGKVENGENPWDAAVREAREEGWDVQLISKTPIHQQNVGGKFVQWFVGANPKKLENYKEKARGIVPVTLSAQKVMDSGMGNNKLQLV